MKRIFMKKRRQDRKLGDNLPENTGEKNSKQFHFSSYAFIKILAKGNKQG